MEPYCSCYKSQSTIYYNQLLGDAMIKLFSQIDASKFIIKQASPKLSLSALLEKISCINKTGSGAVQAFDCEYVINRTHLIGAYINAMSVFHDHTNKTKSASMEMLLFAAMTDQISDAIDLVGAKEDSKLVVFSSSKTGFERLKPALGDISEFRPSRQHMCKVLKKFGIDNSDDTDKLLLQRMAMSRLGP
jgi:tRNA threonylcarbamoyladenosine modification (KEOPS) complex Cgi121 subunit